MNKHIYWPSESTVAYQVLMLLSTKPLGFELGTAEINAKLNLKQMGLNSFLQQAIKHGYVGTRKTPDEKQPKTLWSATKKFRDELQRREAIELEEPEKVEQKNDGPRTQYAQVKKHKTPYELERLIRCAHEVRHSPKEFSNAMRELYEAAGIPNIGGQHA